MRTRASKNQESEDATTTARRVVETAIGEPLVPPKKKNPHAVALSQLGASKGGQRRAENLSAKKRKEIARKAAEARWGKAAS
jgi:hypothetical protein